MEQRGELQLVLDAVLEQAIVLLDPLGRVTRWGAGASRLTGRSPDEVLGQLAPLVDQASLAHAATFGRHEGRVEGRRSDGARYWAQVCVSALQAGPGCAPVGFAVTARDVTEDRQTEQQVLESDNRNRQERSRTEEALRDSGLRLSQAIRAANVGLWDWDLRTNRVRYSAEWKRQIGYTEQEVGDDFDEWRRRVHPDDLEPCMATVRVCLETRAPTYQTEFRFRHKDGSYRWILTQGSVVLDAHGVPCRMLGSHIDVTESKRLADQLRHAQKMRAVGQLASGVAHDFNNLLTVVAGYSETLLDSLHADDPLRGAAHEIHEAGRRASSLTRQLLTFSHQTVLAPRVLDLNVEVRTNEAMLRRLIGEDIALVSSLDPSIRPIKVDPDQLAQVLVNLVVNARDAMPSGGTVTIETRNVVLPDGRQPEVAPGDYVLLAVRDTGPGMEAQVLARVFEPFFTTKGVGRGTGLGLSTVHGIIKQSQGHIEVQSQVGVGTTVTMYLPGAAGTASAARSRGEEPRTGGTESILVVEDDASVRELAVNVLRGSGYSVTPATCGPDALRAIAAIGQIDLIFTDVVMPGMSGRDLTEVLEQRFPRARVLFSSGYTNDVVLRRGVQQERVAFLQKPYTPCELKRSVRQVLDDPAQLRAHP